jgi:glutathione synthase/RimK-type ligase-like ATP-grasp enzyme
VKPAVSASAYETHALSLPLGGEDRAAIERVVSHGAALVQPFIDEVTTDGELSLIFFDGVFSHAAIKRTGSGDFRVQSEHGGTVAPIDVAPAIVDEAVRSLKKLDEPPLYARVDGVGDDRSFRLMELELIEPNVFLAAARGSADRFARAIARRLG